MSQQGLYDKINIYKDMLCHNKVSDMAELIVTKTRYATTKLVTRGDLQLQQSVTSQQDLQHEHIMTELQYDLFLHT